MLLKNKNRRIMDFIAGDRSRSSPLLPAFLYSLPVDRAH